VWNLRAIYSPAVRWSQIRGFIVDHSTNLLGFLVGLSLYRQWGGSFPIAGLNLNTVLTAMGALAAHLVVVILILSAYIASIVWVQASLEKSTPAEILVRFVLLAVGLPFLAYPFGILAAGLYVQNGLGIFLFLMLGLLLVATMARRLSWAVEASRQQSRQLQKLEHLGRDLLTSAPDASNLGQLLEAHVSTMFPPGRVAIWLSPGQVLYKNPADWSLELLPLWSWVREQSQAQAFLTSEELPWDSPDRNAGDHDPVVIAPILSNETASPIGCVVLLLRSLAQPWDAAALTSLFPAVHSLAAQIASALHQAEVYAETLEYQQAAQELAFAGRIQASFLPSEIPNLDGWELAVTLLPARETSGDFFDFIPLPDGRIGLLIADVADKGVGAALYMALCRTLIRTYALEYDTRPDIVILAANERILQDARANLFITAFYGILDQATSTITYCNAGHSNPYLLNTRGGTVRVLATTGMPLGIEEDAVWGLATVQIEPGDVIILYTDGIPDALNSEGEFFGKKQLVEVARGCLGLPAQEIQNCILEAVQTFAGNTPQFDDITLLVMMRNEEAQPAVN
jgi:serine phosphatase RsbU (regulator of sigma subunit)